MSKKKEVMVTLDTNAEAEKTIVVAKDKSEISLDVVYYIGGSNITQCFSAYPQWFKEWIDDLNKNGFISYVDVTEGAASETYVVIKNNGYKQRLHVGNILMLLDGKVEIGERALFELFNKTR